MPTTKIIPLLPSTRKRYTAFRADLMATLKDGEWHHISPKEIATVHAVDNSMLNWLVKLGYLNRRKGRRGRSIISEYQVTNVFTQLSDNDFIEKVRSLRSDLFNNPVGIDFHPRKHVGVAIEKEPDEPSLLTNKTDSIPMNTQANPTSEATTPVVEVTLPEITYMLAVDNTLLPDRFAGMDAVKQYLNEHAVANKTYVVLGYFGEFFSEIKFRSSYLDSVLSQSSINN